jgi:uncharacterized membrane protein
MTAAEKARKSFWTKLRNKFLTGILTMIPLYVTYFLVKFIIQIAPDLPILRKIPFLAESEFLVSLLGFLAVIAFLFLLGIIVSNVIGKRLFSLFERLMEKVPLVNTIYLSSRQIIQTLALSGKGNFKKVVFIEYPRKGLWTLAFVTASSKSKKGVEYVHVFVPTTPNPTSGIVIFLKASDVRPSGMNVEEGLKALISGGIVAPVDNQLP